MSKQQHISIGNGVRPFVIAEMSGNHNGSLERALRIVDAAADAGVQALKIQTYTAETMTLNINSGEFRIDDPKSLWNGHSLYDLYEKAHTPWEWHKEIFDRCRQRGIIGFSTPFDLTSVDFLETLDVPLYKIASFENTDLRLIRYVARTGKPLIISTGLASLDEISEAVEAAHSAGCKQLFLLKCTSAYPANPESANLLTIPDMEKRFACEIGVSDHTDGVGVSVAGVALGAVIIEKHFTLSRADGGVDSAFSLEPAEMKFLVVESERAWRATGKIFYGPTESEKGSVQFRRSLYISEDLKPGDLLTNKNVKAIRPGRGLSTKHYEKLLGRRVKARVLRGTPLTLDILD